MVITAAPSQSLAAELARLLPDLRALIGPDRRCTVVFDRGGYSPTVFTEIITAGFDLLTYLQGAWSRSPLDTFQVVEFTAPDGTAATYKLAERPIDLPVPGRHATASQDASTLTLRLIVRRSPNGHQTPILTNRTDLPAAQIAYRMAARWRQANYFKYAREHFAAAPWTVTPTTLMTTPVWCPTRRRPTRPTRSRAPAPASSGRRPTWPTPWTPRSSRPVAGTTAARRSPVTSPATCLSGRSAPTAGCSRPNANS